MPCFFLSPPNILSCCSALFFTLLTLSDCVVCMFLLELDSRKNAEKMSVYLLCFYETLAVHSFFKRYNENVLCGQNWKLPKTVCP